jgi:hypothetical protein
MMMMTTLGAQGLSRLLLVGCLRHAKDRQGRTQECRHPLALPV